MMLSRKEEKVYFPKRERKSNFWFLGFSGGLAEADDWAMHPPTLCLGACRTGGTYPRLQPDEW